ncbi:hypothetical protein [Massilia frigida]|uniref:hypothetical protein n=1 Tax=Massilia frigida TaxID=2609281 RepID=UPI001E362851|nr:hypothetical protein [Massilia frigida]
MQQVEQQAGGDQPAYINNVHYFLSPNVAQPAAKAQLKPKKSRSAPMKIRSISASNDVVL